MGNIPATNYCVPAVVDGISMSTRSDPIDGYVVGQELGICVGTSPAFNAQAVAEAQTNLHVALQQMARACQTSKANGCFGVTIDCRAISERGTWQVWMVKGTMCVVRPKA